MPDFPPVSVTVPKFHYLDYDTDHLYQAPPVQNQWYTVFDDEDVRLLWCAIMQVNAELDAKTIEVRWTIDGNVYFTDISADNHVPIWVYREIYPSGGGTDGLDYATTPCNAADFIGKHGQNFKVEVRIADVLGTNQTLDWCVRETLETT